MIVLLHWTSIKFNIMFIVMFIEMPLQKSLALHTYVFLKNTHIENLTVATHENLEIVGFFTSSYH